MYKSRFLPSLLVLSLLMMLNSCTSESRGQEDVKKRVFISTDMAAGLVGGWRAGPPDTDDSWAVELISTYEGAVVEGAAVVRGNDLQPAELYAAKRTFIETPGYWNGPILAGGVEPLPAPDPVMWTGDAGSPLTLSELCVNEGVLALADLLTRSKDPVTILAIGPLTDIACLVLNFPDALHNIKEVVFLGGRAPNQVLKYPFSDVVFTDFNIAQDLRATQIILEASDIPVTFITFSLSSSALYKRAQIDSLQLSGCSERAMLLSRASQASMNSLEQGLNLNGLDTFDINAAYYVAKPEVFKCEEAGYKFVECTIGTPGVYNGADNPCAGHGPDQGSGLNGESEQLWVDPSYMGERRTVKSCISYIDEEALERFESGSIQVFCGGGAWMVLPD